MQRSALCNVGFDEGVAVAKSVVQVGNLILTLASSKFFERCKYIVPIAAA